MKRRSYTALSRLHTLEERFKYLELHGHVGLQTFGSERHFNQTFYRSVQWRQLRHHVIARDNGCDLGVEGFEIYGGGITIHHMNPMTLEELANGDPDILDPEFLISVSHRTHNAVHYGDQSLLPRVPVQRRAGDTKLW